MRTPSKISQLRQFKKSQQDRWQRYFTLTITTYESSEYIDFINQWLDYCESKAYAAPITPVLKNSQLNQKVS